jgi:hypothetical protein
MAVDASLSLGGENSANIDELVGISTPMAKPMQNLATASRHTF